MKIGIDISQTAYKNTGVGNYLKNLVQTLVETDKNNEYILFFSSLRRNPPHFNLSKNAKIKRFRFPPTMLDFIWNKLHILSVEKLIGNLDVFITSDWTEPPSKAAKSTIIYYLVVYKTPKETSSKIINVQKRKLDWVKKESKLIFCISESTRRDIKEILKIPENKLKVLYPGINL